MIHTGVAQLTENDLQHLLQVIGAVGLCIAAFIALVILVHSIARLFTGE